MRKNFKANNSDDEEIIEYVIYCRKSTDESSDKQVASIPRQIRKCIKFAKREGLTIKKKPKKFSDFESEKEILEEDNFSDLDDRKTYLDTRSLYIIKEQQSGKVPFKRKKWKKLCQLIQKGKIKGVLSYSPDRQARNILEGGQLINFVDEALVDLKYANFHFEANAAGKMMLGIWFVFSKQYSDKLSEDVNAGNEHALRKGETIGSFKPGYRRGDDSKWEPNGEIFEIVKEAFHLKINENLSDQKIAEYMNNRGYKRVIKKSGKITCMTHQKVGKFLMDPFYYGVWIHGNNNINDLRDIDKNFKPMISEEEFNILQERKESRTPSDRKFNKDNSLNTIRVVKNGFLINPKGLEFSLSLPNRKQRFIPNLEKLKKTKKDAVLADVVEPNQIKLQNNKIKKTVSFHKLDEVIRKKISQLQITKEQYNAYLVYAKQNLELYLKNNEHERKLYQLRINKLRSEKDEFITTNLGRKLDKDEDRVYKHNLEKLSKQIEFNEREIKKLDKKSNIKIIDSETFLKFMQNAESYYDKATYVQKRKIIEILFLNIIYHHKNWLELKVKPELEGLFCQNGRPGES